MNCETTMSFQAVLKRINALDSGDFVGICAHTRPDGDAVGSVLALTLALRNAGINALPLLADRAEAPRTYRTLKGFDFYRNPDELDETPFKLLIVLDTPTRGRLGEGVEYLSRSEESILIDHHPLDDQFTTLIWSDTDYAATTLMVWKLIQESRFSTDADIANACLTGVFSDTGSFRYQNTSESVFAAAAEMARAGANPSHVSNMLYHSRSRGVAELESIVTSRLTFTNGGCVGYSYVSDADYGATHTRRSEGENLIELIRSIEEVEVAILITFGKHAPRVSLRSRTTFNVANVASQFGGGGHRPAAGISWPQEDATLEEILDKLLPLLPER